ncbi:hypothetical protein D3C76_946300 [compost metagenome]
MAIYLLHYCYDQSEPFSGDFADLNKPKATVQRQGRLMIDLENGLEFASDVTWVENFLSNEHVVAGNFGGSNFQLLSWQRLSGLERPTEAV